MRANTKHIKQCVAMSLILSLVLLSGCASKIDEVSQKMMDDINAIGTVEISDEEAIEKAEKLYGTLTDKQKEQVNNYADLLNARDELDKLLEEAEEKKYTPQVKYCARAVITLKRALKNPDSLYVHSLALESDTIYNSEHCVMNPSVYIDISAQNGLGGNNRKIYEVSEGILAFPDDLPNEETNMAFTKSREITTSSKVQELDDNDNVDKDTVLELVEKYEETKDKSLIYNDDSELSDL